MPGAMFHSVTSGQFLEEASVTRTIPDGITSFSCCLIGPGQDGSTSGLRGGDGGWLVYFNNYACSPGDTLTFIITSAETTLKLNGVTLVTGGQGKSNFTNSVGGATTHNGGARGSGNGSLNNAGAGGGGAAGYSGSGGNGASPVNSTDPVSNPEIPATAGTGGGSGGGGVGSTSQGGRGGKTGIKGIGTSGAAGSDGLSGVAGGNGSPAAGREYGGGGTCNAPGNAATAGDLGAIRIMYGDSRSYPSNAADA